MSPAEVEAMGRRFRDARVSAGLSQRTAAARAGIDRSTRIRAERGCEHIRTTTAARALGPP